MKLNNFSGGLNTRVALELLNSSEASRCLNTDLESNQLKSVKSPSTTGSGNYKWYSETLNRWFINEGEYLEYRNKVYNTEPDLVSYEGNSPAVSRGISRPTTPPPLSLIPNIPAPNNIGVKVVSYGIVLDKTYSGSSSTTLPEGVYYYRLVISDDAPGFVNILHYEDFTHRAVTSASSTFVLHATNLPQGTKISLLREYNGNYRLLNSQPQTQPPYADIYLDNTPGVAGVTLPTQILLPWIFPDTFKVKAKLISTVPISGGPQFTALNGDFKILGEFVLTEAGYLSVSITSAPPVDHTLYVYVNDQIELVVTPTTPVITNLTITRPTQRTSANEDWLNPHSGFLSYMITYYNVVLDIESAPLALMVNQKIINQIVDLQGPATPSGTGISHIRLYRLGPTSLQYELLAETPTTAGQIHTWRDVKAKSNGTVLTSLNNYPPPSNLRYLTELSGTFFGAKGSQVFFSHVGAPDYWTPTDYIEFDLPITALAKHPQGLIVFSKNQTFLLTGNSIANYRVQRISADQGCKEFKSIAYINSAVFFVSNDGICVIQGALVSVVSKPKLAKIDLDVANAVVHDEVYYCQLKNRFILCLDLRYGQRFYYLYHGSNYLVLAKDKLYGSIDELRELFQGPLADYEYTTGSFSEGSSSELKSYLVMYFHFTGTLEVEVFINEHSVIVKDLINFDNNKPVQLQIPHQKQDGSTIRFKLTGKGILKELEYKAKGRSNGR